MEVYRDLQNLPEIKNTVVTIGSFDGVHRAHQSIIQQVKNLAAEVDGKSVIISFHPHPRQIIYPNDHGLELLTTLDEKLSLFENFGIDIVIIVPFTVEFSQMDPREYVEKFLVQKLKPNYIVIGYDHKFGLNRQGDVSLLRSYEGKHNFKVVEIQKEQAQEITISSTKARNALKDGDIDLAYLLLGHHYHLSGRVVHGQKLGHTLGFPTANIKVDDSTKLIPAEGIYAVRVLVSEIWKEGMLYIGKKPTVSVQDMLAIEVNIFDFDDNIYDQNITVEFVAFLREDQKFDDKEALIAQLHQDRIYSKEVLQSFKKKTKAKCVVAILTYNNLEFLESFLPLVPDSSRGDIDICIIDNASTDETIEYLEDWHPEVQVIALDKNYGFAQGYNEGLKQLDYEYITILNSDVMVTAGWLDSILYALEQDDNLACAQPKIRSLEEKHKFEYAGAAGGFIDQYGFPFCRGRIFDTVEEDQGQYDDPIQIFWASGAAMVIRRSVWEEAGGFDGSFFAHMEEIDLCWRINNLGYKIKCIPDSVVYHLGGGTLPYASPQKTYLNYRNNLIMIYKNMPLLTVIWILSIRKLFDAAAFWKELLSGNFKVAFNISKAWRHFLWRIPKIKKERPKNQNKLSTIYHGSIVLKYFLGGRKVYRDLK